METASTAAAVLTAVTTKFLAVQKSNGGAQSSAVSFALAVPIAFAPALAFLSVIPFGNLLLPWPLPVAFLIISAQIVPQTLSRR